MTTAKERTGRGALPKSIEVVEAGPSVGWQGGPCADRPRGLEQIRVGWNRRRRSTDPVNLLCLFEVDRIVVRWDRGAVPPDNDPISVGRHTPEHEGEAMTTHTGKLCRGGADRKRVWKGTDLKVMCNTR